MRMLFSKITLDLPANLGGPIQANTRIPDSLHSKLKLEQLLEKGYVEWVEVDAPDFAKTPATKPDVSKRPTKGKWDFRLEDIKNDKLDVLNMKAREHAAAGNQQPIEPFEDVKEALAYMTMDSKS